jgi:hypothetical protein
MNPAVGSSNQPSIPSQVDVDVAPPRRMFLFERGWRIAVNTASHREFCHLMAPGQDFYHRIVASEVFVFHNEEKLCLACAARRGLITFEPKPLRDAVGPLPADQDTIPLELDVTNVKRASESSFADR